MKFGFVDEHKSVWPVRVMCAALGLSASGYYAWRARREACGRRATAMLRSDRYEDACSANSLCDTTAFFCSGEHSGCYLTRMSAWGCSSRLVTAAIALPNVSRLDVSTYAGIQSM